MYKMITEVCHYALLQFMTLEGKERGWLFSFSSYTCPLAKLSFEDLHFQNILLMFFQTLVECDDSKSFCTCSLGMVTLKFGKTEVWWVVGGG